MIMKQIIILAMLALAAVGTTMVMTTHPQLVVACTTGNC
jgi:diphthamide biosynthesis methyltransferase